MKSIYVGEKKKKSIQFGGMIEYGSAIFALRVGGRKNKINYPRAKEKSFRKILADSL
jgi:hypothetical protein